MANASYQSDLPDLALRINQSLLDPHLDKESLNTSCDAAKHFGFYGLCTNLIRLPEAKERLGNKGATKLIAVIAFPFGAIPTSIKQAEAEWAAAHGADELDVVPNFKSVAEGNIEHFGEELAKLASIGLPIRVILDIPNISKGKLPATVETAIDAGATELQTGNGFGGPVTAKDVYLLKELSKGRCPITAAGGLRHIDQALELVEAGANHLGTSQGVELMKALRMRSRKE